MGAQVRWRSRGAGWSWPARGPRVPRLLRPPPPHLLPSQHPRHARLHLRHRRRLRPRHRRRRRGPQPPHPPRACVVRGRASARPLHGGSSASRLATPLMCGIEKCPRESSLWPVSGSLPIPRDVSACVRGTGIRVRLLLPFGLGPPLGGGRGRDGRMRRLSPTVGIRLYWRGESALESCHLCVRGLIHACTEVGRKVFRDERRKPLEFVVGLTAPEVRDVRWPMGSAEVAGSRGRLGAASSVCPLSDG